MRDPVQWLCELHASWLEDSPDCEKAVFGLASKPEANPELGFHPVNVVLYFRRQVSRQ